MAPMYGQVICGPPGCGKTTYCNGMQQYLQLLGRNALVINMDPANEAGKVLPPPVPGNNGRNSANAGSEDETKQDASQLPYETIFDVCEEVVNLSSVMDQLGLGPNGGLVYCMEYLEAHVEDIIKMIQERVAAVEARREENKRTYLIIDLPGQVELYTHSTCVQNMLHKLSKVLDLRLTAVQLIDAHYCADATKFLSAALLGTTTMIRLELPMVSVLSKVDLLSQFGELPFALDFFTDCHDLKRLVPFLDSGFEQPKKEEETFDIIEDEFDFADDPDYQKARRKTRQSRFYKKRAKLHEALAEVVEDYGLLGFIPLDITNAESVGRVLARVDKCNGYVFTESNVNEDMFQCAVSDHTHESMAEIQERIVEHRARQQQQQQRMAQPTGTPAEYVHRK